MKKSDIVTASFVAVIGTIIAFFVVCAIVGDPDDQKITFKDIEVVQKTVEDPDPNTFNSQALNPTVEVYVGDTSKQQEDKTKE